MDRTTLERYLAQAEVQVCTGRARVQRQTRMVEQLKADGYDTTTAEEVLRQFEATLQSKQADRDFIERLLHDAQKK